VSHQGEAAKRLLAVSWEMPPMYGPRAAQVSMTLAELPALGWRPTVVCLAPRRGGPHWPTDTASGDPAEGVEYVRVPSPQDWSIIRAARRVVPALRERPDPARPWVAGATRAAIAAGRRDQFSALVTFAQPWSDHLVGLRVQRATGLPWVAHFSDPWTASPYATPRQRAIWKPMEARVIEHAAALVFVTREAADATLAAYPDAWRRKVVVVPHGFDRRRAVAATSQARHDRLRLVYTGRFYAGVRTPVMLLRALASLARDPLVAEAIEVRFIGPHVEEFRAEAASLGIADLATFTGRMSSIDAATQAADADVLLVIDAPSKTPSLFLPSKLVDYLPLRKPILGITPARGASATLLARLGCVAAEPEDPRGIEAALRDLVARWRAGTLGVGPAFDRVAGEFDIRCTTRQFRDVLLRACGEST